MNGTVTPSVVIAFAIAADGGGLLGSYDWSWPVPACSYIYVNVAGWLHCLSTAPVWHSHGWICGPENTGPPNGWFLIASRAPRPSLSCAMTVLGPSFRPV